MYSEYLGNYFERIINTETCYPIHRFFLRMYVLSQLSATRPLRGCGLGHVCVLCIFPLRINFPPNTTSIVSFLFNFSTSQLSSVISDCAYNLSKSVFPNLFLTAAHFYHMFIERTCGKHEVRPIY